MQLMLRVIAVLMPKYLYTNLVPITDFYASHIHCTLTCICKKNHDILYHGNDVSYAFEQYTFFN